MLRVVAKEDVVAQEGVVLVVALLVVVLRGVEDADPVELDSKRHQVQKRSRIDDRIGQSEKEHNPHVCCG